MIQEKNNQIQCIRGIGCLMIVFYHFYCRYQQIYFNNYSQSFLIKNLGLVGVNLFLVLMGYYLVPTKTVSPIRYSVRRFKKIYIQYIISVIVIYLFSFSGYLGANREVSTIAFILNIFMLNGFVNIPYVDGAHWYMTYTIVFIIIMAIGIYLKKEKKKFFYIIWIIIEIGVCISTYIIKSPILEELKLLVGGIYTPFVIIGIVLRNRVDNNFTIKESAVIIGLCFISIILSSGIFYLFIASVLIVIVWNAVNFKLETLERCKWIIVIGDVSYVIYLIHQNIGYMIMNYFKLNFNYNTIISLFLTTILVLILTYIINFIYRIIIGYKDSNQKKYA